MNRFVINLLASLAIAAICAGPAHSQDAYPNKPIRIVVPWAPGGSIDFIMRIMVEPLTKVLGQTIIIDNRAGATGVIGAEIVANAAPDGYTIMFTSASLNMVTAMGGAQPYKVPDAFVPIMNVAWSPMVLVSYPPLGLKSPADLVAFGKTRKGDLFYATSGNGAPSHFTAELFRLRTGVDAIAIPTKGSPQAMTENIAGRVQYHFSVSSTAMPMVKDGRVTALAVTSKTRLPAAPDIPTMDELGFKDFYARYWNGIFAPKGTPQPIIDKLAAAFTTVLSDPAVIAKLAPGANEYEPSTPRTFEALLKEDLEAWRSLVKAANIKLE